MISKTKVVSEGRYNPEMPLASVQVGEWLAIGRRKYKPTTEALTRSCYY